MAKVAYGHAHLCAIIGIRSRYQGTIIHWYLTQINEYEYTRCCIILYRKEEQAHSKKIGSGKDCVKEEFSVRIAGTLKHVCIL